MIDWLKALPGTKYEAPFAAPERIRDSLSPSPVVVHVEISYRQWDGPIGQWAEHFGKGRQQVYPLVGTDPIRSCNEVEIAKLLRAAGRSAYWVSCYNPSKVPDIWRPYTLAPEAMPDWLQQIDGKIRARTGHPKGGIPDVVSWDVSDPRGTVVFVECKGPKEKIKAKQEDWVCAAVEQGLEVERFAVAIRTFGLMRRVSSCNGSMRLFSNSPLQPGDPGRSRRLLTRCDTTMLCLRSLWSAPCCTPG